MCMLKVVSIEQNSEFKCNIQDIFWFCYLIKMQERETYFFPPQNTIFLTLTFKKDLAALTQRS